MDVEIAVPFFLIALVPTGLLSILFVWLLRSSIRQRLARALVGNSLSLLALMMAGDLLFSPGGRPGFETAFLAFFIPQGIWTLFAALPRAGRGTA